MPSIGFYQRTKPRLQVIRGFDFQNPAVSKVRTERVKTGQVILSGQVCSLEYNSADAVFEFVLGVTASTKGRPYIALGDSTDADSQDAEKFLGLDPLQNLVLETGFYTAGTYTAGNPVTFDAATGNIKPTTLESGEAILGFIESNGIIDVAAVDARGLPSNSTASNGNVVRISTVYLPNTADAT
jgi:hypothetical protein